MSSKVFIIGRTASGCHYNSGSAKMPEASLRTDLAYMV
ncbi:hypothetical protein FOYG_12992 [Fusarium oxysporum NRRL 32931]|uniref:Uncharacterized protein n=3 Tax=Fusarium oxysporum TaxID=5507 RepID=W9HSD4_FUSOX|nr:hypothetical protein FOYG_12992 [Fusarium oxysporum NRRL 32931]EXA33070.1 hypothetical protein FOVG_15675 [Fusarium oxysporum f. sp. pisi HDV247]EXM18915.1 hypothetical protein FOTG_13094 [Fusarium oxysporum f. sp. vasinfectum 25433]